MAKKYDFNEDMTELSLLAEHTSFDKKHQVIKLTWQPMCNKLNAIYWLRDLLDVKAKIKEKIILRIKGAVANLFLFLSNWKLSFA